MSSHQPENKKGSTTLILFTVIVLLSIAVGSLYLFRGCWSECSKPSKEAPAKHHSALTVAPKQLV